MTKTKKDGQANYPEFLAAMASSYNSQKKEKLCSVFNLFKKENREEQRQETFGWNEECSGEKRIREREERIEAREAKVNEIENRVKELEARVPSRSQLALMWNNHFYLRIKYFLV